MNPDNIRKQISDSTDKKFLEQFDKFLDIDLTNDKNDVNKHIHVTAHGMSESEYEDNKQKRTAFFLDLKDRVKKRLLELAL